MKRILVLCFCLFAVCLGAGAAEVPSIGGSYKSTIGKEDPFDLMLMQDGLKVTGTYAFHNGRIEGELKGRTLTGRWKQDGASGRFSFEFSKDGKSFQGRRSVGDAEPDKRAEAWNGKREKESGKHPWVLVDKKSEISEKSFEVNVFTNTGEEGITSCTMEGTAESVVLKGTESPTSISYTFRGGYEPLTGPYRAGEKVHGQMAWKGEGDLIGVFFLTPFQCVCSSEPIVPVETLYDRWKKKPSQSLAFWFDPANARSVTFEIPFPEDKKSGLDYYVCIAWNLWGRCVSTTYHFRWNGEPEAVGKEKDKDSHSGTLWTILVSIGVVGIGVGAFAGGLFGGSSGGGSGAPEGPADPPAEPEPVEPAEPAEPTEPVEEDRKRFLRPDDPDYVRNCVSENEDGTLTLVDPGGGPAQTLYPKYDPAGNQTGWFNQNFNEYTDDDIREWSRWRSENADLFQEDQAQAEWNQQEQREMNEKRDRIDRERGSTREADEWKKWLQHEEHMEKLSNKYGVDREHVAELKKAVKRDMTEASISKGESDARSAWWDERIAEAELTESMCDTVINTVGEATPQTKMIKTQYNYFKTVAKRTAEGIADNKGVGHVALKVGQGVAEVVIPSTIKGPEGAVVKTVMNDLIEGEKSAGEIYDHAKKTYVTGYVNKWIGDVVKGQTEQAYNYTAGQIDVSTPEGINELADTYMLSNLVEAAGGEILGQTVTNPLADEILTQMNEMENWEQTAKKLAGNE